MVKLPVIVKLGSRSKVYLKSLIRDLDLKLEAIIAMSPPPTHHQETFLSRITLKEEGGPRVPPTHPTTF